MNQAWHKDGDEGGDPFDQDNLQALLVLLDHRLFLQPGPGTDWIVWLNLRLWWWRQRGMVLTPLLTPCNIWSGGGLVDLDAVAEHRDM